MPPSRLCKNHPPHPQLSCHKHFICTLIPGFPTVNCIWHFLICLPALHHGLNPHCSPSTQHSARHTAAQQMCTESEKIASNFSISFISHQLGKKEKAKSPIKGMEHSPLSFKVIREPTTGDTQQQKPKKGSCSARHSTGSRPLADLPAGPGFRKTPASSQHRSAQPAAAPPPEAAALTKHTSAS